MGKIIYNGIDCGGGGGSGGAGGSSVYSEKQLYKASVDSFQNISVTWDWEEYDAYIFNAHDTCLTTSNKQNGDSTILTKAQIKNLIDTDLTQYFYRGANQTTYKFSANTITAMNNSGGYFVTEIIGLKFGTLSPIIYSEEEREVGVWIDNKPLYAKTWKLTTEVLLNNQGVQINAIDTSGMETLVQGCASYSIATNTKTIPVLAWKYNNTTYYASSIQAYVDIITLYYTKTTDVAGSGSYNTLGVPNVHYTDDWHVVGTWWNGKPIYEKTFHYTTANLPTDRMTIEKIYNFDELVGIDGYFGYQHYSNDYRNYKLGEAPPQLSNKAIYLLCEGNDQVNDIQDLDFSFNGLDRSKIVYISATVRITKTTD